MWDFPLKMGNILDILYTYILWTAFKDSFGYCGVLWKRGGIFLGKWEKCCDLFGDLLANAGGEVYLPVIVQLHLILYCLHF